VCIYICVCVRITSIRPLVVLDPIPQSLPVHFFGSRPQPPTSPPYIYIYMCVCIHITAIRPLAVLSLYALHTNFCITLQHAATQCNTLQRTFTGAPYIVFSKNWRQEFKSRPTTRVFFSFFPQNQDRYIKRALYSWGRALWCV